jgi:hypothetical protein
VPDSILHCSLQATLLARHGPSEAAEEPDASTPRAAAASATPGIPQGSLTPSVFGYPSRGTALPCSPGPSTASHANTAGSVPGTPVSTPGAADSPQQQQMRQMTGSPLGGSQPSYNYATGSPSGSASPFSMFGDAANEGQYLGMADTPAGTPMAGAGSAWHYNSAMDVTQEVALLQRGALLGGSSSNAAGSPAPKRKAAAEVVKDEGIISFPAAGAGAGNSHAPVAAQLLARAFPRTPEGSPLKRTKGVQGQAVPHVMGDGAAAPGGWMEPLAGNTAGAEAAAAAASTKAGASPAGPDSHAGTGSEQQQPVTPMELDLAPIRTTRTPPVAAAADDDGAVPATAAARLAALQAKWPAAAWRHMKSGGHSYVQQCNQPICAHCDRQPTMEPWDSSHTGGMGGGAGFRAPAGGSSAAAGAASGGTVAMWRVEGATPGMYPWDGKNQCWNLKTAPSANTASLYCSDRAECTAAAWRAAANPSAAAAAARAPAEVPPAPKVSRARRALGGAAAAASTGTASASGGAAPAEPQLVELPWRGPVEEYADFGADFASMRVSITLAQGPCVAEHGCHSVGCGHCMQSCKLLLRCITHPRSNCTFADCSWLTSVAQPAAFHPLLARGDSMQVMT